jgi:hypothetical protein
MGNGDRMKNFIVENKRRIRSRSRNNEKKNRSASSRQGGKKSTLKKAKESLFNEDAENPLQFNTYSDQAI